MTSISSNAPARDSTCVIFTVPDRVGALQDALQVIREQELSMARIESRPTRGADTAYDFFVDFEDASPAEVEKLIAALKEKRVATKATRVEEEGEGGGGGSASASGDGAAAAAAGASLVSEDGVSAVPWFPRKISDLDMFTHKVLAYGEALDADHPGFTDQEYRERRDLITKIAREYKHGRTIPRVDYTEKEIETWGVVYKRLTELFPTHACRQLNYILPLLEANCGYGPDNIPQLQDISDYLKQITGWSLRPVTGLLSARDFLNGLAFRVFHSTQYIRHHSAPLYTPEPDVCHELLGHVPLFADEDFADFSQEIGLASLGATDEDIERLATCYWFTVEFGICREGKDLKAYGAGLLSSFGELTYCLGGDEKKPEYAPFDPSVTATTEYPITKYQPKYFIADSFSAAKDQMVEFAGTLKRPFGVRYHALTQSVEVLNERQSLKRFVTDIGAQLRTLNAALDSVPGLQ